MRRDLKNWKIFYLGDFALWLEKAQLGDIAKREKACLNEPLVSSPQMPKLKITKRALKFSIEWNLEEITFTIF